MYKLSEAAARDIEKLLERSVVDFGLQQTEYYFSSLKSCLQHLADNPEMGNMSDDIRAGYRRFVHQSHVVFYHIIEQEIFVIRILHKHMDVSTYLDE